MKIEKDTRGIKRYIAFDIHKEYALAGGQNAQQEWVMAPRRVRMEKLREWAVANLRKGDAVVTLAPHCKCRCRDDHECVGRVRHRGAAGELCGGGACGRGEADRGSAGQDRQERHRTADPPADRGHCAGGLGTARGSARTARDDLVSQSAGKNQHDTCTCVLVQV